MIDMGISKIHILFGFVQLYVASVFFQIGLQKSAVFHLIHIENAVALFSDSVCGNQLFVRLVILV